MRFNRSPERCEYFLTYLSPLGAVIMIPIENLKEDGLSPCAYGQNKIRNTHKLPK